MNEQENQSENPKYTRKTKALLWLFCVVMFIVLFGAMALIMPPLLDWLFAHPDLAEPIGIVVLSLVVGTGLYNVTMREGGRE